VSDEIVTTMDVLPTLARMAGAKLPARPIDGVDIRPILVGDAGAASPWDKRGFMYYRLGQLQAVRAGPWKLYLPLTEKFVTNDRQAAAVKTELFDVRGNVGETREVSGEHPDVVRRLMALADAAREELGDEGRTGRGQRPAGFVAEPKALGKQH
jgi:arylsulfatase A-like enzyme